MIKEFRIKFFIVVFILLSLFVSLFRFIFYSPLLSNDPSIILARNWYQNTLWETKKTLSVHKPTTSDFKQIYTFQVQKWDNTNLYRFIGKFIDADINLNTIKLLGSDNHIYVFKISDQFAKGQNQFNFTNVSYSPKQDQVDLGALPFTKNSSIDLYWDDSRTLVQILSSYSKDTTVPLNENSNRFFLVRKLER